MSSERPNVTASFLAILGIGGLAAAVVAIALGFNSASQVQHRDAARDLATLDLVEQRESVASLYAAETAAAVTDTVTAGEDVLTAAFTAERLAAQERAAVVLQPLADRADSVGDEARRWLAAISTTTEPTTIEDTVDRLVAYDTVTAAACCAGIVTSDEHHTPTVTPLEQAVTIPGSLWTYVYLTAELQSTLGPGIPAEVQRFLSAIGTPDRLPADSSLPSQILAQEDADLLLSLGVAPAAIDHVLGTEGMEKLDRVVAVATGAAPADTLPSVPEVFMAVDHAYRVLDEAFVTALTESRAELLDEVDAAARTRMLTTVLTPLMLIVFAGLAVAIYLAARRREAARERERHLLDARNRFMRMVSHEVRTPTTAISGFAQTLYNEWTGLTEAEITEFLHIIDRQTTQLSLIVDDLLTLSHLETGRLRLHLAAAPLEAAAREAADIVAERYGVPITVDADPTITVVADRERLVQVLRNLVENAARYGKTDVSVAAYPGTAACEIVVSDTGQSVPPDAAERLFRFWNRGGEEGDLIRGHGMGLAIARHLARAMVGDLVYRAHDPIGSEFVLTLPLGPRIPQTLVSAVLAQPEAG
jgi:signal transduction histidine kinase